MQKESEDKIQFPTKIGAKINSDPSFCKISFPAKHLMPYYAKTGLSHL
jgi:hypothetical protein